MLSLSGTCIESSLSISAYFNCRIEHAAGRIPQEISGTPTENSNATAPEAGNSGNEGQNPTLDLLASLQNDGMTVKKNLVERCCRRNLIRRTTSRKRCMHLCNGNFMQEQLEKKKYLDCMDVMLHIVNCYRNFDYEGYFVGYFLGEKDL